MDMADARRRSHTRDTSQRSNVAEFGGGSIGLSGGTVVINGPGAEERQVLLPRDAEFWALILRPEAPKMADLLEQAARELKAHRRSDRARSVADDF